MTLFSRCDIPADVGRHAGPRSGRHATRRERTQALAAFMEEIGILFRYATGRDYYDRRLLSPKD